jgi:hypothetical protein
LHVTLEPMAFKADFPVPVLANFSHQQKDNRIDPRRPHHHGAVYG